MRVRWTATAADDLAHIVDYIRKDNPAAARRVAQTIYQGIAGLRKSPNIGRIGLAENTRELIFSAWPYIAVYKSSATRCRCFVSVTPHRIGRNGTSVTTAGRAPLQFGASIRYSCSPQLYALRQ